MGQKLTTAAGTSAAIAAMMLGGAVPALAAKHGHRSHVHRHGTTTTSSSGSGGNGETALTGSTLSSASAAATSANAGASVDSASTETDSSLTGAAYEVHITKSDGTHAVVIEDSSFNVLATQAAQSRDHGGRGR
jgi:hypothetical protein